MFEDRTHSLTHHTRIVLERVLFVCAYCVKFSLPSLKYTHTHIRIVVIVRFGQSGEKFS